MKKSGAKSKLFGILVIIISIVIFIGLRQINFNKAKKEIEVSSWDNLYEENNIQMYYINNSLSQITELGETFKTKETATSDDAIQKTYEMNTWLKDKCSVSEKVMDTNKNATDILVNMVQNTTLSLNDYSGVLQELLSSVSVITRIGTYRAEEGTYNVLEVWSPELNKWVVFDVLNDCFYSEADKKLSAIELLNSDLKDTQMVKSNNEMNDLSKKDKSKLKGVLETYSIKVDNSKYEESYINSYITYVKSENDIQLETDKSYLPPTIFISKPDLIEETPHYTVDKTKSDSEPTIILCKKSNKSENGSNTSNDKVKFTVGAFMNSTMMNTYYIRVNGGQYEKVNTYLEVEAIKGENKIELSTDGTNTIRTIVFNKI